MSAYSATLASAAQASEFAAKHLSHQLASFLAPILRSIDLRLDRRLVSTFLATPIAIVEWRNRAHGLLLSELGAYLLTPAQAPAGTKRVSNLLRSPRWSASLIADWLWQQADIRVQTLREAGEEVVLVWDGSVLEKPETIRGSVCRTIQQGAPAQTYSPGLLQSTGRSPDLHARPALARVAHLGTEWRAHRCSDALVDAAW